MRSFPAVDPAILEALPHYVWISDERRRVSYVNANWLQLTGLTGEQATGFGWLDAIHPDDVGASMRAWECAVRDGVTFEAEERLRRADGTYVWTLVRAVALEGSGGERAWLGTATDFDKAKLATERSESRYKRLIEANIIGVLTSNNDGDILEANDAFLDLVGYTRADLEAGLIRWIDMTPPEWLALDRRAIEQLEATGQFAAFEKEYIRKDGSRVPILLGGARLAGGRRQQICYILDLSRQKQAESALRFIAQAGVALQRSLDLETTLETLLDLLVPAYGEWTTISLREPDGRIKTIAGRHADPAQRDGVNRLLGNFVYNERSTVATPNVYRHARSEICEEVTDELLREAIAPQFLDIYRGFGLGSFVSVPILLGGSVIGNLGIASTSRGRFSTAQITVLEELALRAALALENALLYQREHRVAYELQKAALPASLPEVPGFVLSSCYEAGKSEALIGGDWYDAVRLPDGRLVLSIGDVSGSGINAAVTMSNMRQTIRGSALAYAEPSMILDAADRALRAEGREPFVTALVAVIDPVVGTLHYASAGHPMPLVRDADGRVRELDGSAGPPLGLRSGSSEPARTVALDAGCTLVLFTDGLTEATRDLGAGEVLLREAVASLGDTPASQPDARALRDAVLHDGAPDDVAILVVRYTGETQVARWTFDSADAEAARATRLEMVRVLERAGANVDQITAAELVYSELIGNVVRHAPGRVDVALDVNGRAPILHVLDRGPSFVADPREQRDVLAERGRGLFIASHLSDGLQITARHDGGSHARATLVPPSRRWTGGLTSML